MEPMVTRCPAPYSRSSCIGPRLSLLFVFTLHSGNVLIRSSDTTRFNVSTFARVQPRFAVGSGAVGVVGPVRPKGRVRGVAFGAALPHSVPRSYGNEDWAKSLRPMG